MRSQKGGVGLQRTRLLWVLFGAAITCIALLLHYFPHHARHELSPLDVTTHANRRSSYQCKLYPDYLQVCEYSLLCFDGRQVVLVDDAIETPIPFPHKDPQLESVNWEPKPAPPRAPSATIPLPWETKTTGYYIPSSDIDWTGEGGKRVTVEFLEGSMWLLFPETPGTAHLWHSLVTMMPLWTLQFANTTRLSGDRALPPIDDMIIYESNAKKKAINYLMLRALTQPHTRVRFHQDIMVGGVPLADETKSKTEPSYSRGSPLKFPSFLANRHLVCAKRGVIPAYKYELFSGPAEAFTFRQAVYSLVGISFDPKANVPNKVVIVDRVDHIRAFNNPNEILRIVQRLNLPFQYVANPANLTAEDQVRLFFDAGLSIHPHGASITNTMFQRPKTAVIEVFTYHHHQAAFAQLANAARLLYFPLHTYVKGDLVLYSSVEQEMVCRNSTVFEMGRHTECLYPSIRSDVDFPSDLLELTIVSAMRAIGHPILPSAQTLQWLAKSTNLEHSAVPTT